jgi:hypothetical protein
MALKDDEDELFAVIAAFHFTSSSFPSHFHVLYPHFVEFFWPYSQVLKDTL